MGIFKRLQPAPVKDVSNDELAVKKRYRYWRIRTFYGMYIGYAFYYFTRKSLPFLGGNPAVLSIQGSYTQNMQGTLGLNFFNQSNFSQLIIAKTASLAGNLELGLILGFSILPGQTFLIMNLS